MLIQLFTHKAFLIYCKVFLIKYFTDILIYTYFFPQMYPYMMIFKTHHILNYNTWNSEQNKTIPFHIIWVPVASLQ